VCEGDGIMSQDTHAKTPASNAEPAPAVVSPFPDVGGLYLIVAGILLGVLLGPAILGRVAPQTYQDVFVGGAAVMRQIDDEQAGLDGRLEALEATGVTEAALHEQLMRHEQETVVLQAKLQQAQRGRLDELTGWAQALMLAVIAVMVIESLLGPDIKAGGAARVHPALGRLITARYALSALWVALLLARPELLKQLPIVFVVLLIAVALATALVPLGKKAGS